MNIQKIRNLLIEKGYYEDDHAVSSRCIKDVLWAYKKLENEKVKKLNKVNSERTRKVLVEKRKKQNYQSS